MNLINSSRRNLLPRLSCSELVNRDFWKSLFGKHEILQDVNSLHVKTKKYSQIIMKILIINSPSPKKTFPNDFKLLWIQLKKKSDFTNRVKLSGFAYFRLTFWRSLIQLSWDQRKWHNKVFCDLNDVLFMK